jgi:hypothetical protein
VPTVTRIVNLITRSKPKWGKNEKDIFRFWKKKIIKRKKVLKIKKEMGAALSI